MKPKITIWFSNGAASAIATKQILETYSKTHNITIVNNPVLEEHEDNLRFKKDIEEYFQHEIIEAKNKNYPNASIVEIFDKRNFMSSPKGAPCTLLLKKEARYQYELNNVIDFHVLGFTVEEWERQKKFNERERSNTIPQLITSLTTKADCFKTLRKSNIKLPVVYEMGLPNANCLGCVKATSPTYWNLTRELFLKVFEDRAEQSRRIGAKLVRVKGKRIFLDELKTTDKGAKMKSWECGIFCDTL